MSRKILIFRESSVDRGASPAEERLTGRRLPALPEYMRAVLGRALDFELAAAKCVEDSESYDKLSQAAREHFGLYFLFLAFQHKRYSNHVQLLHMAKLGELESRVDALTAALQTNLETSLEGRSHVENQRD
jgi:hypothetical protein